MKTTFARLELFLVTGLLIYYCFAGLKIAMLKHSTNNLEIDFNKGVLIPITLYAVFLLLNYWVIKMYRRNEWYRTTLYILLIYFTVNTISIVAFGNSVKYFELIFYFFGSAFFYLLLKESIYQYVKSSNTYRPIIKKFWLLFPLALIGWFVIFIAISFFFREFEWNAILLALWSTLVPYAAFIFFLFISLLVPKSKAEKHTLPTLLLRACIISAILYIPVWILSAENFIEIFDSHFTIALSWALINSFMLPLALYTYKRKELSNRHTNDLKVALKESVAQIDFLRSQINPHFLYNALNTLYASALLNNNMETAQGIQKLGDMMRFMLDENHKDSISLEKEIDYMQNFIDLQLIRTRSYAQLTVTAKFEDCNKKLNIAPMLLIPFVENAFKHGVSQSSPSFIALTLTTNEHVLVFQITNSIHTQANSINDLEKYRKGIGIQNVKQRLELIYADKYELEITKTITTFSVNLKITLS